MTVRAGVQIFISLFVLVNPLEGIPFFLARTGGVTEAARTAIARRAATAVTIILLASVVTGAKILDLFGIHLPAFQVGGGIILFLIALQMTLVGVSSGKSVTPSADDSSDIAIIPLAIPLLGGPGAISGAILYGTRTQSVEGLGILCGLVLLVGLATYASLRAGESLRRVLGATGINIATRIMGLLIAAIAVQLTVEGLLVLVRG